MHDSSETADRPHRLGHATQGLLVIGILRRATQRSAIELQPREAGFENHFAGRISPAASGGAGTSARKLWLLSLSAACVLTVLRRAQAQIAFFERAIPLLQHATDESLLDHVHAYHAFLLGRARDDQLWPSFEVEVVWRAHLLSPIEYAEVSHRFQPELGNR